MSAPRIPSDLAARLHRESGAARWQVTVARFAEALAASAAKAFGEQVPSSREVEAYLRRLHLADVALACACADGDDGAWEAFVREQRPGLYRAADAMMPDGGGRELADALYGELFGASASGDRRSLFRYFHGRSSLSTWLRAVLAQRHVDRIRAGRRFDALPEDDSPAALAHSAPAPDPDRPRWLQVMRRAIADAIAALDARDRLRLGCYYAQDLTLAQIGRALGEHEATVSRHLARTRRALRDAIEQQLREGEGLGPAAIAECLASVMDDPGSLDMAELIAGGERKNPGLDRST